ncbi:histone-lysine N-methyltransferase PRDM7 [Frankliniella occidentalis]|uniref:Histone-lysine N-methyltransferase PRDM7 n=1 Tax=Frankliniella occidentalis TaxID=133901 RepID=A0A6J1RRK2_FRAOC|nr:histone-lysine N-methyltransferase PRDM7 [Frankliniella occidentalis]
MTSEPPTADPEQDPGPVPGPSTSTSDEAQGAPRYPKRAGSRGKLYTECPALDDDDFLFCDDCGKEWEGDCPEHGPLHIIPDKEVSEARSDRALHTVPSCLAVLDSKIPGAGLGVWAKEAIPRRVRFGPYVGEIEKKKETGYGWGIRPVARARRCTAWTPSTRRAPTGCATSTARGTRGRRTCTPTSTRASSTTARCASSSPTPSSSCGTEILTAETWASTPRPTGSPPRTPAPSPGLSPASGSAGCAT